jgi:L-ascorbate metabolism protein UlaG (beta-lactamase superfamily)
MHFSARGIFDRNKTLWCGYLIEFQEKLVYFAGDTAFGTHFAQIREKFGSPHLALLPIGAYEPRWFMGSVHMAPDEAIKAHETLAAKTSIAIHHGTFKLTDEGIDTPAKLINSYARPDFLVLKNGEVASIP